MNSPTRNKQRTDRAVKNWSEKITEQQASGQEPGEFCRQRNLCSTSFYAWRKRLGMNGATPNAVVKIAPELPVPVKVLAGAGFLRLDPGRGHKELVCGQSPRVLWIDTPGGYRVAVNGGAGLAEVFGLFKDL